MNADGSGQTRLTFAAGQDSDLDWGPVPSVVTICHRPGTPAQKTLVIPQQALAGHLSHGDTVGTCQ